MKKVWLFSNWRGGEMFKDVVHLACVAGGIRGLKEGSLKYRLPKN